MVGVCRALLTHSVGQGPVALQLLCFYFPQSSPLCQEVEDAVAVRRLWKAPPLRGCSCCHLLPSELHSPAPVPSAREHGYDWGSAVFSPNLQHSVLLFHPCGRIHHVSLIWGWSQCTAAFARGEQQWKETVKWCHCTISWYFYKTSGIQSIALLMSHSSRQEHWNVHYFEAQETRTSIYSDSRNLLVFQTPQEKHYSK